MRTDTIIILDFGGQYAHLIADRIRRLKVYSEIHLPTVDVKTLAAARGLILSGGPSSVYDKKSPQFNPGIFSLNVPTLGLCYGHQLMAQQLGGRVAPGTVKEYGLARLSIRGTCPLFKGLAKHEAVWMSHGDTVQDLPPGFQSLATTPDCALAAMGNIAAKKYGLQFHPEVTHTVHGMKILDNFVKLCKCRRTWTMQQYFALLKRDIRVRAKNRNVFLLVSGGVDSTVAFALLNRILGTRRVYGLHIDNGLMRQDESRLVMESLRRAGFNNLHITDASRGFIDALAGVTEPEAKRRIIGDYFLEVKNRETKRLGLGDRHWLLGQGTIYPDTIETGGTQHADTIKTHHNRVDAVQKLIARGLVLEPLASLYKDEVRALGRTLKLPASLLERHPFPGPGLGVRLLCSKGKTRVTGQAVLNRRVSALVRPFQYQGQVLPVRSVGVQGDSRTFTNPVMLQGGKRDWARLEEVSTRITNQIHSINRVVYLLSPARATKVVDKPGYMTKDRLDLLRRADWLVMESLRRHKLTQIVWQFPVVLIPISTDGVRDSVVLRPVLSREAMTAKFAPLPWKVVDEMVRGIKKLDGIDLVLFDITHKPPATIEWE